MGIGGWINLSSWKESIQVANVQQSKQPTRRLFFGTPQSNSNDRGSVRASGNSNPTRPVACNLSEIRWENETF